MVVITSEGDHEEYNLPKSQIAGYDGELGKYKSKLKEDFQLFSLSFTWPFYVVGNHTLLSFHNCYYYFAIIQHSSTDFRHA